MSVNLVLILGLGKCNHFLAYFPSFHAFNQPLSLFPRLPILTSPSSSCVIHVLSSSSSSDQQSHFV